LRLTREKGIDIKANVFPFTMVVEFCAPVRANRNVFKFVAGQRGIPIDGCSDIQREVFLPWKKIRRTANLGNKRLDHFGTSIRNRIAFFIFPRISVALPEAPHSNFVDRARVCFAIGFSIAAGMISVRCALEMTHVIMFLGRQDGTDCCV
jgi:hypothetical protein